MADIERRRITWVAILLTLLASVFVLWSLSRSRPGERALSEAVAAEDSTAPEEALAPQPTLDQRATLTEAPAWSDSSIEVLPGVRLAGDGWLTGRVLDRESGAGVPGVRVDLLPITPSATDFLGSFLRLAKVGQGMEQRALPIAVTKTGGDGSFRFEGVRRGTYFVDARGPYHVPDHIARVQASPSGAGGPVDVYVRRGGRVLGRVLDSQGRGVRARVALFPAPASVVRAFRTGELRRMDTRTDGEGRFLFAGVRPGSDHELHAMGDGFAITHAGVGPVIAGQDQTVELVVREAQTVRGRVFRGASKVPLAGAQVACIPQGLRDLQFVEEVLAATLATSDAEGRYRLRNVPLGEVEIVAVAPGLLAATSPILRISSQGEPLVPDLILQGGPQVEGTVRNRAGQPLSGVHVRWFTDEIRMPASFDFRIASLLHQAVGDFEFPLSDAEGRFVAGPFPGEPPYSVYFALDGYAYHRERWDPAVSETLEVTLEAGGRVEGLVMDADEALPIPAFLISGMDRIDARMEEPSALNPFSGGQLVEHPEGRFAIDDVRPGRASLVFEAPGYHRHELEVEVTEGETKRGVIVSLRRGGTVRGRVLDPEAKPVSGAQVAVVAGDGWNLGRAFQRLGESFDAGAYSDSSAEIISNRALSFATRMGFPGENTTATAGDGSFELTSVEVGSFVLVVRHRDFAQHQSDPLFLTEGESIEGVEITLSSGAGLYGRVHDRWDRPIADALVVAMSPAEYSGDRSAEVAMYSGRTDASGDYTIEHMVGGGYFVALMRADDALSPMTLASTLQFDLVNVPFDRRQRYDILDQAAGAARVFGQVRRQGELVRNGGLMALSFESESVLGVDLKAVRLDSEGAYEFPGLAPGAYRFVYQDDESEARLSVEVPEQPEVRIDLELPHGAIAGRVVEAESGRPLPNVDVVMRRAGDRMDELMAFFVYRGAGQDRYTVTESDGSFRFSGLEAATYELSAYPPPELECAAGEPTVVELGSNELADEVELALERALSVSGFVRDATGAPVGGATILLYADGEVRPRDSWESSPKDGSFDFPALTAGLYTLDASAPDYASTRLDIRLQGEDLRDVELILSGGAQLELVVHGPDGEPVPGAVATLHDPNDRIVSSAGGVGAEGSGIVAWFAGQPGSDAEGQLSFGPVAPGTYRIEVRRGNSSASLAVEHGRADRMVRVDLEP